MEDSSYNADLAERSEGFDEEGIAIDLGLSADEVTQILGKKVSDAETYWNKELDIDNIRKTNQLRWENKNLEVTKDHLYKHQVPYRDNRIFLSVETKVANLVKQFPEPVVIEGQDTDASREMAQNYGKVLKTKAQRDWYLKQQFQMVTRHILMGYRVGILKWYWDFDAGRLKEDGTYVGDAIVKFIRPHRIIFEEAADDPDNIPLIAETMSATVEELIHRFPEKRTEILKYIGLTSEAGLNKRLLGKKLKYREIWFTFFQKNQKKEGVAWKLSPILLGAGLNPYFNYDGKANFFDKPRKPYVLVNYYRTGEYVFDNTSLTEQSATLQDVLEKRGRQIVENADQANSTLVFNSTQIPAKDAKKYVGNPRQIITVKGDVRTAVNRVPPPLLPSYVYQDKLDARQEIDNIFGTHGPIRGEKTESPTLGQEVISQRADLGRDNSFVDSLEKAALQVYEGVTQLYKVFGVEEHIVKYAGENSRTTFVNFSNDIIEDGMELNIQPGSMMPDDKTTDRLQALELAKLGGRIDPLSLFEKLHVSNPKQWAKRLFLSLFAPDRYMSEVLEEGQSEEETEEAKSVIMRINTGENVPPKPNASKNYVAAYNQFIRSPAFQQLDPEVQQLHMAHAQGTVQMIKQGDGQLGQQGQSGQPQPNIIQRALQAFGGRR